MAEIDERQLYWLVNTKEGYEYYQADYVSPGEDGHLYVQKAIQIREGTWGGRESLGALNKDYWLSYRQITKKEYEKVEQDEEYV